MAITTSTTISPKNYFYPLQNPTKLAISKCFHHFLLPQYINTTRIFTVNSSVFTSPVFQEEHSPVLPLVEFTYGVSQPDIDNSQTVSEDMNMNKLLKDLLGEQESEHLAWKYYEKAKENLQFKPQKTTLKALLKVLIRSKKWDLVYLVSKDMMVYQVLPEVGFCARVVSVCIKARKFNIVDSLLECFVFDKKVSSCAYCSALKGYNKLHMYSITIDLHERMKLSQVVLDPGGYVYIMEAYIKLGDPNKVIELFGELEDRSKMDFVENWTQIYVVLFKALGMLGQGIKAHGIFEQMCEKGILPNGSIYASLIGSLAELRQLKIVEDLVEEAESKHMLKDPALFLKLVIMYVEEGLLERTIDVVSKMRDADLKISDCIFCAIVNGYAKKRGLKAAARVYQELTSQGIEPGQVTYASIINVYFRLALFSMANKVFDEMQQKGFDKCVVAYSTMIVMYGKTGRLRDAMKLLAKMKERGCKPNVWVYNSLIDLHGKAKNLRQVDKIWKEMKRRRIKPDRVSYTSIIGAYSKAREYDTSTVFYEEYRRNGGKIDLAMAGIMVGVFSKINRIEDLITLLQDLKVAGAKLDAKLYRSALNALRDSGLQVQARWLQESFEMDSVVSMISPNRKRRKIPVYSGI